MGTLNRNFISADQKVAINSYGTRFHIGDKVKHQDPEAGTATIISFSIDEKMSEVTALTDKGTAHIDFIEELGT